MLATLLVAAAWLAAGCQREEPPPAAQATPSTASPAAPTLAEVGTPPVPGSTPPPAPVAALPVPPLPGVAPPPPKVASAETLAAYLAEVVAEHPDEAMYQCEVGGALEVLELDARLDRLCRRAPEMGPCQYERSRCRARGGVVRAFDGTAVTAEVEAVYDKRVMRVRFGEAPARK